MEFSSGIEDRATEIADLFEAVFAASEGAEEGRLIGDLVRNLLATTPEGDLHVFCARDGGALAGCIIFTRLRYDEDGRYVVLLAPVAVATARQGKGIGQALLTHGLDQMRSLGAEVAITYGDPAYYGKVGFKQVGVDTAAPPLPLQMPQGWLAIHFADGVPTPLRGPSRCVPAFDDPAYW